MVFGGSKTPAMLRPPSSTWGWQGAIPPLPPAKKVDNGPEPVPVAERPTTFFRSSGRRKTDLPWAVVADDESQKILAKWRAITDDNPGSSQLGRHLRRCADNEADVNTIIKDTFESKRNNTLLKRAGSVLLYLRWHRALFPTIAALPFGEPDVYKYICDLRTEGAPPTRAQAFVEAVNFTEALLGLPPSGVGTSARVAGAALACYKQKRLLKQRDPISMDMLASIEDGVMTMGSQEDRIFFADSSASSRTPDPGTQEATGS